MFLYLGVEEGLTAVRPPLTDFNGFLSDSKKRFNTTPIVFSL